MNGVRPYAEGDLDDVLSTWENASAQAHPFLTAAFQAQVKQDIPAVYLPNADTWVVDADHRVVGFISLLGNEVGALFIHPAYQGKGFGKRLLDKAKTLHEELVLGAFIKNERACAFYAGQGFEVIEERMHEPTGEQEVRFHFKSEIK